jgi:hypothetical protein
VAGFPRGHIVNIRGVLKKRPQVIESIDGNSIAPL